MGTKQTTHAGTKFPCQNASSTKFNKFHSSRDCVGRASFVLEDTTALTDGETPPKLHLLLCCLSLPSCLWLHEGLPMSSSRWRNRGGPGPMIHLRNTRASTGSAWLLPPSLTSRRECSRGRHPSGKDLRPRLWLPSSRGRKEGLSRPFTRTQEQWLRRGWLPEGKN